MAKGKSENSRPLNDFKIACILDDFSYECFKYEAEFIQLEPENWREILEADRPDLLLVESAWEGKERKWRNTFYTVSQELGGTLYKLANYCKEQRIPTVFWNKEDPVHFAKFIAAAKLFDYVFTTDIRTIPHYKSILGHDRIHVLPFAAQPMLHNPLDRNQEKLGQVAFAGTWYRHHAERTVKMAMLLDVAADYQLDIYDRKYQVPPISHFQYPAHYQSFVKGCLPYEEMVKAYKKYDVFLNVDSVPDSPTMFSRRVFELLASGIPIVSAYSIGISNFFPEIVLQCKTREEAESHLRKIVYDKEFRDRIALRGQREVFNKHSYRHRLQKILDTLGLEYEKDISGVSVISICRHPDSIDAVLANYYCQSYPHKELIILADCSMAESGKLQIPGSDCSGLKLLHIKRGDSLQAYFSKGVEQSSFGYIAIFNEIDYYAPNYLGDFMHGFLYTGADIVGKHSCYSYQNSQQSIRLHNAGQENCYVNSMCSEAMVFKKELFKHIVPGEMINFEGNDIKVYSADRFNYLRRGAQAKQDGYLKYISV